MWGANWKGGLGQNSSGGDWPAWSNAISSPVQVGSDTTWGEGTTSLGNKTHLSVGSHSVGCIKTDGTLWMWGQGDGGKLAQNDTVNRSSPVQIPGTNWKQIVVQYYGATALKTDGTLWTWGDGGRGALAQNNNIKYSSPVQIPGTTWSVVDAISGKGCAAIKTDGTLWSWGYNYNGALGNNEVAAPAGDPSNNNYSSPIQIPGTTWSNIAGHGSNYGATVVKTDGTMWSWGQNDYGQLGLNNTTQYSSPNQIPGTNSQ